MADGGYSTVPLGPVFGAVVSGFDLTAPVTETAFAWLSDALGRHGVLLFRDQSLEPAHILAWSRRFGPLERHSEAHYLLDGHDEIVVIGNLVVDGVMRSLFVNAREEWHFDYAYAAVPSIAALFYAVEVPPQGGDTVFADMRAAYDGLSVAQKARVDGLIGVFSYEELDCHLRRMDPTRRPLSAAMRRAWPPVRHPIVQAHSSTGRKALRLSPQIMTGIEGLPADAANALIAELSAYATQPRFLYRHRWQPGDLVLFDNRSMLHTATPFDAERYRRIMYRTTIMAPAA